MRENAFIRQNLEKWSAMQDALLQAGNGDPDTLAQAYQVIVADLAYAQTHYPESRIATFLNDLALAYHVKLYRRHPSSWRRFVEYWKRDVPMALYDSRRDLLIALMVFLCGVAIGIISQVGDTGFARIILGDSYMEMTRQNIASGEPMAVYDGGRPSDMFLYITLNNIGVALRCFAMGVLTLFGTGLMLLYNAIMLGSFTTFFAQQDLLWESTLAIWLHGTLEISAIVVSGAGGVALGTGWLFPGTYTRMEAFKRSAYRGLKVLSATIPMFVVAGFIEGFFTRHTEWPDALRAAIIFLSALLVILYIIVYPRYVTQHAYATRSDSAL